MSVSARVVSFPQVPDDAQRLPHLLGGLKQLHGFGPSGGASPLVVNKTHDHHEPFGLDV